MEYTPLQVTDDALTALLAVISADIGTPRSLGIFGESGNGKTSLCGLLMSKTDAVFIELMEGWSLKFLLQSILFELGEPLGASGTPGSIRGSIPDLQFRCIQRLAQQRRPLIIDEADVMITKPKMLEAVRGIVDKSQVPLVYSGEDSFPDDLSRVSDRSHNRVREWVQVPALSLSDAKRLRDGALATDTIMVEDDLTEFFWRMTEGNTRRFVANMSLAIEQAQTQNRKSIAAGEWGQRRVTTGVVHRRRVRAAA